MTLAGKEAIQCLETWMLHLSKKVDQASTEPWDDALSWEREKMKNDMGKKRDEENATLGGKLMLFVKMLPELVAHKSGETKQQSTEAKEEAEARLTLTHRVKSMNTEEMVLSEILHDVDEALQSSSPSLTVHETTASTRRSHVTPDKQARRTGENGIPSTRTALACSMTPSGLELGFPTLTLYPLFLSTLGVLLGATVAT